MRQTYSTGTVYEEIAGFSRAIRVGQHIFVAGTTATDQHGVVGKNDLQKQTLFIIDKIEQAITKLGGSLKDVVRMRIYIRNIEDWETVAKIHGEKFNLIRTYEKRMSS